MVPGDINQRGVGGVLADTVEQPTASAFGNAVVVQQDDPDIRSSKGRRCRVVTVLAYQRPCRIEERSDDLRQLFVKSEKQERTLRAGSDEPGHTRVFASRAGI